MSTNRQLDPARRVELILQQLDELPTLSPIATRLLSMTSSDDTQMREVVRIVSMDPSLASRILKLCRCHPRGRRLRVVSIDRAVMLLGFEAVRGAVLSVQVFDLLDKAESPGGEEPLRDGAFDRMMFWKHSIAVGAACEQLADLPELRRDLNRNEAFLSGLLHDLGQLALHVLLPRSFEKVCTLAESTGVSIDQASRRVLGLDTHLAGKRLAEHWGLPNSLADVLWLHGQPYRSLPELPHKRMIGLVSLGDAVARRMYLTSLGHGPRGEKLAELAEDVGVPYERVEELMGVMHSEVNDRANAMGMDQQTTPELLLQSIGRANETLGRMNRMLRGQASLAERQHRTLQAITEFHDERVPGASVGHVLGEVVRSAAGVFGGGFFAMLYQARSESPWQLYQFTADGRLVRSEMIDPPHGSTAVDDLADDTQVSMQALAMLPWLSDYLGDAEDLRHVRLLPLRCGWGVNAVLLHDCQVDGREARDQLAALSRTWAAAIAAAAQHAGAKALGEQLADANRMLIETQDELARSQIMASLGEMAAGAAHEMNNPLTVISGRSQLLAGRIDDDDLRGMAEQIVEQSHRLSDMITALRTFAEPSRPDRRPIRLRELLEEVVASSLKRANVEPTVSIDVADGVDEVLIDPDHLGRALGELVRNAAEAEGSSHIAVRVQIEASNDRLMVQVTDNGSGLTEHILTHAFDPFFSAKPAGRQPGLGLALARCLIEVHGGQVRLENGPGGGAQATIWLPDWRPEQKDRRVDQMEATPRREVA